MYRRRKNKQKRPLFCHKREDGTIGMRLNIVAIAKLSSLTGQPASVFGVTVKDEDRIKPTGKLVKSAP